MKNTYIIEGKNPVHGEISIGGSEDISYISIITSILSSGKIVVKNVPDTERLRGLLDTLRFLGSTIEISGNQVNIQSSQLTTKVVPEEQSHNSVYEAILLGVLGVKFGRAAIKFSGKYRTRELELHLSLLNQFFSNRLEVRDGFTIVSGKVSVDSYTLPERIPSLTIHALLLACLGKGEFKIKNVARTAMVDQIVQSLQSLGAQINFEEDSIIITRVSQLSEGEITIPSDKYEAFFWIIATLLTNGEAVLESVSQLQLAPLLSKIEQMNGRYKLEGSTLHVWKDDEMLQPLDISVQRAKGIDDRIARMISGLAVKSQGQSTIKDAEMGAMLWDETALESLGVEISYTRTGSQTELHVFGPSTVSGSALTIADPSLTELVLLLSLMNEGTTTLTVSVDLFVLYDQFETKLKDSGLVVRSV